MEKKILVIEDSQVLAHAYSLPFQRRGYRVQIVGDGRVALGLLRSFEPDGILLDLILPKVPGSVILEAIRLNPTLQSVPVILFTNALLRPDEEERLRKLATRFFHKAQTSPEQVAKVMDELIGAPVPTQQDPAAPIVPAPAAPLLKPQSLAPSALPTFSAKSEIPKTIEPIAPKPIIDPPVVAASEVSFAEEDCLAQVESMPIASAPAALPQPESVESNFQEIEALARKLVTEQNEDQRTVMLAKIAGRLHTADASARIGVLGRLTRVFEDLVADLLANPKLRSPASIRTLLQACPFLLRLLRIAQRPGQSWAPRFTKTLVVDDSGVSLRSVTKALEAIQLSCVGVANPLEAVEMLAAEPFDLVMLDVDMPHLTGQDVCKKLRSMPLHAKTPVIFLTSFNRFDVRVTTARAGGDDFVAKPFMPSELAVKALTHIFRRHLEAARI